MDSIPIQMPIAATISLSVARPFLRSKSFVVAVRSDSSMPWAASSALPFCKNTVVPVPAPGFRQLPKFVAAVSRRIQMAC
jgi:hypothetical protein